MSVRCDTCKQEFETEHGLSVHEGYGTCEPPKQYKCDKCYKSYDSKHSLLVHYSHMHDYEEFPYKYNQEDSPTYGKEWTDEERKRQSRALTKFNKENKSPLMGHEVSEETRRKIAEGNRGKTLSEETKMKMSRSRSGEKHWNWKGGISNTWKCGSEWNKTSNEIRERDNYTCQFCGLKSFIHPSLDVHHITPKREGGTDRKGNLISLCAICHGIAEHL